MGSSVCWENDTWPTVADNRVDGVGEGGAAILMRLPVLLGRVDTFTVVVACLGGRGLLAAAVCEGEPWPASLPYPSDRTNPRERGGSWAAASRRAWIAAWWSAGCFHGTAFGFLLGPGAVLVGGLFLLAVIATTGLGFLGRWGLARRGGRLARPCRLLLQTVYGLFYLLSSLSR